MGLKDEPPATGHAARAAGPHRGIRTDLGIRRRHVDARRIASARRRGIQSGARHAAPRLFWAAVTWTTRSSGRSCPSAAATSSRRTVSSAFRREKDLRSALRDATEGTVIQIAGDAEIALDDCSSAGACPIRVPVATFRCPCRKALPCAAIARVCHVDAPARSAASPRARFRGNGAQRAHYRLAARGSFARRRMGMHVGSLRVQVCLQLETGTRRD